MSVSGFIWARLGGFIKHRTGAVFDLQFLLASVGLLPGPCVCVHCTWGRGKKLKPSEPSHPSSCHQQLLAIHWLRRNLHCGFQNVLLSLSFTLNCLHLYILPSTQAKLRTYGIFFPAAIFPFKCSALYCFCSEFYVPLISMELSSYLSLGIPCCGHVTVMLIRVLWKPIRENFFSGLSGDLAFQTSRV